MSKRSLFTELHKRKVVREVAIYVAVAWGVPETIVALVEQLFLPQWTFTLVIIFFGLGTPVAMFLSWTFDLANDGIQHMPIEDLKIYRVDAMEVAPIQHRLSYDTTVCRTTKKAPESGAFSFALIISAI